MLLIAGAMRLLLLIAGAGAACTNTLCEKEPCECGRFVAWQATFFCTEEFCPSCPHAGGCDLWCGLCDDEPLIRDCHGHRAPSGFVGDAEASGGGRRALPGGLRRPGRGRRLLLAARRRPAWWHAATPGIRYKV